MPNFSRNDASTSSSSGQKAVVSVAEMARLCGLSRARFYQLLRDGVFSAPKRNPTTNRPYFDAEGQAACLKARATNQGVNGKAVLFYCRRVESKPLRTSHPRSWNVPTRQRKAADPLNESLEVLLNGLKQLGLEGATPQSVIAAKSACFPEGIARVDDATILTAVFRHLNRQNSGGNVGR